MLRCRLGLLLVVLFFKEEVGAGGEEGVRRVLRSDGRNSMAVLGAEAA